MSKDDDIPLDARPFPRQPEVFLALPAEGMPLFAPDHLGNHWVEIVRESQQEKGTLKPDGHIRLDSRTCLHAAIELVRHLGQSDVIVLDDLDVLSKEIQTALKTKLAK